MSQLNTAIKQWRLGLKNMTTEQADELEDHLRHECHQLQERGLSEQEQVLVARPWLFWSILWTLFLWCIYRIGFFVPYPGVDMDRMIQWLNGRASGASQPWTVPSLPGCVRIDINPMFWGLVILWAHRLALDSAPLPAAKGASL